MSTQGNAPTGTITTQKMNATPNMVRLHNGYRGNGKEVKDVEDVFIDTVRRVLHPPDLFIWDLMDNFFEIGGNSVLAATAVDKLRHQGFNISLHDFFAAEILKDLLTTSDMTTTNNNSNDCGRRTFLGIQGNQKRDVRFQEHDTVLFGDATINELQEVFRITIRVLLTSEPFILALDMNTKEKELFIAAALREIFHNVRCQSLSFFLRHRKSGEIKAVMLSADFCYQCHASHEGIPFLSLQAYLYTVFKLEMKHRKSLRVTTPGAIACQIGAIVALPRNPIEELKLHRYLISESLHIAKQQGYKHVIGFHGNALTQECAREAGFAILEKSDPLKDIAFKTIRPFQESLSEDYRILVMSKSLHGNETTDRNSNENVVKI
ncbi:uncharacterized protein LOC144445716 [Glandiceps talaboti]